MTHSADRGECLTLTWVLARSVVALLSLPDAPTCLSPSPLPGVSTSPIALTPPIPSKEAPQPLSGQVTRAAQEGLPPLPDAI